MINRLVLSLAIALVLTSALAAGSLIADTWPWREGVQLGERFCTSPYEPEDDARFARLLVLYCWE